MQNACLLYPHGIQACVYTKYVTSSKEEWEVWAIETGFAFLYTRDSTGIKDHGEKFS